MKTFNPYAIYCLLILVFITGCSPTVRLDTPEPVKINVDMNVNVTTQNTGSSASNPDGTPAADAQQARRYRMKEVQQLKNDRRVGEGRDGLLHVVNMPTDNKSYANYVEKLVQEENQDRKKLFEEQAKREKKNEADIAAEFAQRAIQSSFPGEWVQTSSGEWKTH